MILIIIIKRLNFSSEEEEKKKKDGTHVAKFQQKRGENFCMILGAHTQVNERALSLSIALKETTHEKTFFFVCPWSVFFVCGIEIFFGLFFPKTLFFIQKSSYKTPLEETLIFFKVTARATEEEKELIKKCLFSPPKILITFLFVISLKEVYFLFCCLLLS